MSSKKLAKFFLRLLVVGIPLGIVLVIAARYVDTLISPYLGPDLRKMLLAFIVLVIFYAVIGRSMKEAVDEQKKNKALGKVGKRSRK